MPAVAKTGSNSLHRRPRDKRAEAATQRPNRKKHANTRTALQKNGDLAFLTKWRLRGLALDALVEKLNESITAAGRPRLSRKQVALDLKCVDNAWRAQREADITVLRDRELAKLDADEAELLDAWENSKLKQGSKRIKRTRDGKVTAGKGPAGDPVEVFTGDEKREETVETSDSYGDPAIYAQILAVRKLRAQICGWNAPQKVQHSGPDGGALPVGAGAVPIVNVTIAPAPANE